MKIRVGTASWTDPGFVARWYPKKLRAADRLAWYAEHFNLVEVNSSFYAVPARAQVKKWCEQTPDGFVFDVKLHRLLSRCCSQRKWLRFAINPYIRTSCAILYRRAPLLPLLSDCSPCVVALLYLCGVCMCVGWRRGCKLQFRLCTKRRSC